MVSKEQKTQVENIIREMVESDSGIIAAEIASEIKKRLNFEISNKEISAIRRKIGLGRLALVNEEISQHMVGMIERYINIKEPEAALTEEIREVALNMSDDVKFKEKIRRATKEDLINFFEENGFKM